MTENEQLADQMLNEITRAALAYLTNKWTAEQFLLRLRAILRASEN